MQLQSQKAQNTQPLDKKANLFINRNHLIKVVSL